jgi:hypothetical protein
LGEKPPILDYTNAGRPAALPPRKPINFAGCLIPISMVVFVLGVLVLSTAGEYGRSNRIDIYLAGAGILVVAIAVLVTYFVRRTRSFTS